LPTEDFVGLCEISVQLGGTVKPTDYSTELRGENRVSQRLSELIFANCQLETLWASVKSLCNSVEQLNPQIIPRSSAEKNRVSQSLSELIFADCQLQIAN
jgi:hypothetical protein